MRFHKRRLSRRHSTGLLSSHYPSTFYASACSQCVTWINKDRQNDWLIGRPTKHDHLSRTAFNVNYIASSESKVDISKPKHNRRICRRHWYWTASWALSFLSDASSFWATITSNGSSYATATMSCLSIVSDIAVFVLKGTLNSNQPILSVCNSGVLWPNGWMDQDENWHGVRSRPRTHCVRWGPSSPPRKGAQQPPLFGPLCSGTVTHYQQLLSSFNSIQFISRSHQLKYHKTHNNKNRWPDLNGVYRAQNH